MSYPAAEAYVDQFPKEKTAQAARYVSVLGAGYVRYSHRPADLYHS